MHFPKGIFPSPPLPPLPLFFYICDARICIAAHRTIEKRDVRSSGARKIAGFIDRIALREKYAFVHAAGEL